MPLLGALSLGLFTKLLALFAALLGRKLAVITAGVTTVATITAALTAGVSAIVTSVAVAAPSGLGTAVWLFVPYNFAACAAALISIDTACTVYAWHRDNVRMAAQIAGS